MSIKIPLTKGLVAIVDDIDADLAELKWHVGGPGYAVRMSKRKAILMHRVIGSRMGFDARKNTDHINRNKLDNRRSNLRPCTQAENVRNSSPSKNNTSGAKGVYWWQNRWKAAIKFRGKQLHLGCFKYKKDAIAARRAAEIKYFGAFAP